RGIKGFFGEENRPHVKFVGFVDTEDVKTGSADFENYFHDAIIDYGVVEEDYRDVPFKDLLTEEGKLVYGQKSLEEALGLAKDKNKQKTALDLANRLKEKYPESKKYAEVLKELDKLDTTKSVHRFNVDGIGHLIQLKAVEEPNADDISVKLEVDNLNMVLHYVGDEIVVSAKDVGFVGRAWDFVVGSSDESMTLRKINADSIEVSYKCPQEKIITPKLKKILVGERLEICGHTVYLRDLDVDFSLQLKINSIDRRVGSIVN
ncbi:unnamed protein product, partial [marine sediment metagenome]